MARFLTGLLYSLFNVVVEGSSRLTAALVNVLSDRVIILNVEGIVKQGAVVAVVKFQPTGWQPEYT